MPRLVVIKQEMNIATLTSSLLSAKVSDAQASTATDALKTLNPHLADLKSIKPGTVVLVPDSPNFKDSASTPAAEGTLDDFSKLVKTGISDAADRMRAANAARAEERAEVVNVQKLAAVKKAAESDPQLKQQLDDAAKAAKAAQQEAAQAEKALDTMLSGATTELTALSKLLG
jgi:hypothetical protein